MKKAYNNKGKYLFFLGLLSICLVFFNLSCGLDVLDAVLEDPFSPQNIPNKDSEYDASNFSFTTSRLENSNSFGKAYIYYKIYNKESIKNNEVDNIASMTNDSTRRYNSATTLINTYSYKELHYASAFGASPLPLALDNDSQDIYIRLTNYSTDAFKAQISVNGKTLGIPLRYNGKSFDFGRPADDYHEKPVKISGTSSSEESATDIKRLETEVNADGNGNTFYVVLYGLFYMPTESFEKIIYSPVHYLGEVRIDSSKEFN